MGRKFCYYAVLVWVGWVSCKTKQYPCPAYGVRTEARIDSSGRYSGGFKANKDRKTGLLKKKKNKKMYDKKPTRKLF